MTNITLNINKTIEQNAEVYYERAKKYKKKIPGIKKIIEDTKKKIQKAEEGMIEFKKKNSTVKNRKKEWFEKFRWFMSSDGFLVIGGRDATTNDIVVKKYLEKDDRVFHTELAGSPFVIIKNPEGIKIPESTINDAAEFCASFSKSWKAGRTTAEVYYVNPDQVSQEAKSGEYLQKGSFMVYGKRNFMNARLNVAIGVYEGRVMSGPISSIKKYCEKYVEVIHGSDKLSDVAKKIKKIIGGDLDEIIRSLPPECMVKK
jgi:predicted ribosome quality control (RQC) complex YloA/Tae2 family protein